MYPYVVYRSIKSANYTLPIFILIGNLPLCVFLEFFPNTYASTSWRVSMYTKWFIWFIFSSKYPSILKTFKFIPTSALLKKNLAFYLLQYPFGQISWYANHSCPSIRIGQWRVLTLSTCLTLRSDSRAVKLLQILRPIFLAKNQFYISSNVGGVIFRANVGKPDYKEELTTAHPFTEMSAKVGKSTEIFVICPRNLLL